MRDDKDLAFLEHCRHEELDTLVHILIFDKDGKKRLSESLHEEYKQYSPQHNKYWDKIATELQCYGGNTIINTIGRSGKGIPYRKILEDVSQKEGVNFDSTTISTQELEERFIKKVLKVSLENLTNEQRRELLRKLNISTTGFTPQIVATLIKGYLFKRGIMTLTTGGIGVLANIIWTVSDVSGPAYRVTIPAILEIIHLRRIVEERKNPKTFIGRAKNWLRNEN